MMDQDYTVSSHYSGLRAAAAAAAAASGGPSDTNFKLTSAAQIIYESKKHHRETAEQQQQVVQLASLFSDNCRDFQPNCNMLPHSSHIPAGGGGGAEAATTEQDDLQNDTLQELETVLSLAHDRPTTNTRTNNQVTSTTTTTAAAAAAAAAAASNPAEVLVPQGDRVVKLFADLLQQNSQVHTNCTFKFFLY